MMPNTYSTYRNSYLDNTLRLPYAAPRMKIGLLGGSFNPPHQAHLQITLTAMKRMNLDRVWWIVSLGNPLKDHRELAPIAERIALCQTLIQDNHIVATGFEATLELQYTVSTLQYLRRHYRETLFVWLMGGDNLVIFDRWHQWQTIFNLMPIAVIDRPHTKYEALASRAACFFKKARIPENASKTLPGRLTPAWTYLSGPLSNKSSTLIRQENGLQKQPFLQTET